MIIFCDGVFDLFHKGHINHFKKIKELYPLSKLIVGILNDKETEKYKRKPIFNENKRKLCVESCKYVDDTILDYPIIMNEEFIKNNNIDLIVHAFSDENDFKKQRIYFDVPIKLNKMKILDYYKGINSTLLIKLLNNNTSYDLSKKGWDKIWELKGIENTNNLKILNGYENTDFCHNDCYNNIINTLNIKKNDKLLEIGCGGGFLSQLFDKEYDYYGIDYSNSLILKNIKFNNTKVINCSADNLPFKDKYFDYTFSVGVFEYFPSKDYANNCLKELLRVSKKGIYIVDIRNKTHKTKQSKHKYDETFTHLIYNSKDFDILEKYKIIESTYEKENRFSILKIIDPSF